MKNYLSAFFKDKFFYFWTGLIINIISWLVIAIQIRPTKQTIPIHYNIFYGVDTAQSGYWVYVIPLVGLLLLLANFFFYRYAKNQEEFATKILIAAGFVSQIFILLAVLFLRTIIL